MPDIRHKFIRLPGHDYTCGTYFVTLCTNARAKVFGTIAGEGNGAKIELSDVGRIVEKCWRSIPEHFRSARIGEMQIMPDHMHAILILGVDHEHRSTQSVDATVPLTLARPNGPRPGSLGAIIGAFKSETTKRVNLLNNTPGLRSWQRDYYEIIRDDVYERIATYIAMNARKWRSR